jgi:hypothetical protein
MKLLLLALLVALLPATAFATVTAYTIGTTPVQVVAAFASPGVQRRLIIIDNESASTAIACAWDGATPAVNSAGSFTIAGGSRMVWAAANVTFGSAISCIAASASTPVTVQVQ